MKIKIKKPSIKKLWLQIAIVLGAIFIVLSTVSSIVLYVLGLARVSRTYFLLGNMLLMITGLIMLAYFVNLTILQRVRNLSKASREISKGNYDVVVKERGVDELSLFIAEFNAMTRELKANEYLSKDFARNISHEFKTPLATIKGYAELIHNGKSGKKEQTTYAKIIMDEADRLLSLSKSLLNISLLDSNIRIKCEDTFRVDEQIRQIILLFQREWEAKNISIDLDLCETDIVSNREFVFQIWQNLISNALKFTKDKIHIKLFRKEKVLRMEITDNGPGILEKDRPKVFKQFFKGDSSRSGKNTGLGLSIVKKIVDKLNGKVDFISQVGVGTTFFVELPA